MSTLLLGDYLCFGLFYIIFGTPTHQFIFIYCIISFVLYSIYTSLFSTCLQPVEGHSLLVKSFLLKLFWSESVFLVFTMYNPGHAYIYIYIYIYIYPVWVLNVYLDDTGISYTLLWLSSIYIFFLMSYIYIYI